MSCVQLGVTWPDNIFQFLWRWPPQKNRLKLNFQHRLHSCLHARSYSPIAAGQIIGNKISKMKIIHLRS